MPGIDLRTVGPGFEIDGFTIKARFCDSGMSTLWVVERREASQPLIMKIPAVGRVDPVSAMVGFENEQAILPLLEGPYVPRFVANGELEVLPYLVMELIEGANILGRYDHTPLPLAEIVEIGQGVAAALHDLHQQRAVHLDIKPSNIMRRPDGRVVLVDFGLSHHEDVPDLMADLFHVPVGTSPYLAPELIFGIRNDPRSDLFSLGVLLYTLATGVRPFGFPRHPNALRRRLWRPPVPPCDRRPDLPPWFQEIVLHLLEIDQRDRYQTAGQLLFDLGDPAAVTLTERATRSGRPGWPVQARAWARSWSWKPQVRHRVSDTVASAPIILVAVDVAAERDQPTTMLELMVRRILLAQPLARVVCLNVIEPVEDPREGGVYFRRSVEVRAWSHRLNVATDRLLCMVVPAEDPAAAIVAYAKRHSVDQIVIGSHAVPIVGNLGPTAARVVAEADCTVTVVRSPCRAVRGGGEGDGRYESGEFPAL